MAQGPTPIRVVAAILSAALLILPVTATQEGRPPAVYLDTGRVPTAGYGHTGPDVPKVGTPVTDDQATRWLAEDLVKHGTGLARPGCVRHDRIVSIPAYALGALIDFAYNVGITAACNSTLVAKVNAGDMAGASAQFDRWVYDDGRVVKGLVKRRMCERALFDGRTVPEQCFSDFPDFRPYSR